MSNTATAIVYRTAPNMEHKAACELKQHGINAVVPYDDSGKRKRVTAPGYVFAGRSLHSAFVKHVRQKVGQTPVDAIARLYVLKPAPEPKARPFGIGDRVRINVGPFATMEGTVTKDRNRAYIVAVDGLNVSAVSVHPNHMIRIDPG